jgi:hypothetical protein
MKLKIFIADNYILGKPSTVFDQLLHKQEEFEKHGVTIVDKVKQCDIVLANQMDCYFEYLKKPVIICERYDASSIGCSYHYYSHKSVKAIFKNFIPRDKELLLADTVNKRYHYSILADIYDEDHKKEKIHAETPKFLHKFRQVTWFLPITHLDLNKHNKLCNTLRGTVEKDIDIFCISHDHEQVLEKHRREIREKVESELKDYKTIIGNNFNQNDYHSYLARSKVCIAPWGLGERIALDQKAILSDCIVIKPDTDFVLGFPDIYNENYYVKIKQDLTDLVDVCKYVLQNYDKYKIRTERALNLLNNVTYETYIENICQKIKEVYSEI